MPPSAIAVIVLAAVVSAILLVVRLAQNDSRSSTRNSYQKPTYTAPTWAPPRPAPPVRVPRSAMSASNRTPVQVRAVLQRQLGQAYADEQERVRLHVLRQEQKVAARLARAQRLLDFEELKALHAESRQTADHAYRLMAQARKAEDQLWSSIKQTYQTRDASGARSAYRAQYTQTANALHQDKDLVHSYLVQYKADVDRLNQKTGRLRDSINANCGAKGREWYGALMARTAARREGRMLAAPDLVSYARAPHRLGPQLSHPAVSLGRAPPRGLLHLGRMSGQHSQHLKCGTGRNDHMTGQSAPGRLQPVALDPLGGEPIGLALMPGHDHALVRHVKPQEVQDGQCDSGHAGVEFLIAHPVGPDAG